MTKAATQARLATYVPVAPIRERFLDLHQKRGLTMSDVAKTLGWYVGDRRKYARPRAKRPDSTRVARVLGLRADTNTVGTPLEHKHVTYENAVKLCRALDMAPVDAGV